jgi:hypothetical protein
MEPVTVAIICATVFGAVVALSAFIRQLILSRNQSMNDKAQNKAVTIEAKQLADMRKELEQSERFNSHYQMLGSNREAVRHIDENIEQLLEKKTQLIDRYSSMAIQQSHAIIDGECNKKTKSDCDRLKLEMDKQLEIYDEQLHVLQERRAKLWDTNDDLQFYLIGQESKRNEKLDYLYQRHSGILEKLYIHHNNNSLDVTKQTLSEGTSAFKMIILAPLRFLMGFFGLSKNIDLDKAQEEIDLRDDVSETEDEINDIESSIDEENELQEDEFAHPNLVV